MTWLTDPTALAPAWAWLLNTLGSDVFEFPVYFLFVVVLVVIALGVYFSILDTLVHHKISGRVALLHGGFTMGGYVVAAALLYALHLKLSPLKLAPPTGAPTPLTAAAQVALFMVAGEFLTYWWHRLEHGSEFVFKHVHYLHHGVDNPLTVWTNFVVHPVEGLMVLACLYALPLAVGAHPLVMIAYAALNTFAMVVTHCGYELRGYPAWLLPRAAGHELHHSERRPTNLSVVMTYGDKLFGTYKPPVRQAPPVFLWLSRGARDGALFNPGRAAGPPPTALRTPRGTAGTSRPTSATSRPRT